MSFKAKYRGICADCGSTIHEGDEITYDEHDEVVHVRCIEEPEPVREVCQSCWLEKPCPCEDGL
jgi:hypothetical protein